MELWTSWWTNCSAYLNRKVRAVALFMVAVYRVNLSGLTGCVCRFEPSCSCYAQHAFEQHPPWYAFKLTVIRLLKCHPLGPFGFDPVPSPIRKPYLEK